jgi:hypothetical protein
MAAASPVAIATPQVRPPFPVSQGAPTAAGTFCDAGRQIHNPSRSPRCVGNTPFAQNVRDRAVSEAIVTAGSPPPTVSQNGVSGAMCVSGHARGKCFENCARCADHGVLMESEATQFQTWCALVYA